MGKIRKNPLMTAVIICILSLAVMVTALALSGGEPERGVFVPPAFDEHAVQGTPDVPEHLGWNQLDAQVYKVSLCGVVTLEEGKADVWLTNPKSNTVWLKLRMLDEKGNILGESGLIRPGEYVQSIHVEAPLKNGDPIGLKVMAYEPDTYYSAGSATLNTIIVGGNKR